MKVSSRVTGATFFRDSVVGSRLNFGPVRSPGPGANRLEVIENGLGVIENGLELSAQGRRCGLIDLGTPENGLELVVRGGGPRSSRLELSGEGEGTEVEWLGSGVDRDRWILVGQRCG